MSEAIKTIENATVGTLIEKRVLVVEDDEGLNNLAQKSLRRAGFDTQGVLTGADAIKRVIADPVLTLLVDQQLPDMAGTELVRALIEQGRRVPFVAMTGHGDENIAVEMMKLGARDYLVKGFDFTDLLPGVFQRVFRELETERRLVHAEQDLRENEQRLELVLQGADLATWDLNVITGEMKINERWAGMLGYTLDEIKPHLSTWEKLIHPDDIPVVMETFNAHTAGKTGLYETEHRLKHKSGDWVWILDRGRVIERDTNGRPLRACGTHLDITDRKRPEKALQESEEKFRLTFNSSPDAVNINRLEDGLYVEVNDGFTQLTGFTRKDVIGKTSLEINIWHNPTNRQNMLQLLREEGSCENLEFQFQKKDGTSIAVMISARVISLNDVPHIISIIRDISKRKLIDEALRALAESEIAAGDDIFRLLVRKLAVSTGMNFALLSIIEPEDPSTAHTIAVWNDDKYNENFSYALAGTPCQNVIEKGDCFYPCDIQNTFPQDHSLVDMKAESYWGIPVKDNRGNVLGILAVLDIRPMVNRPQTLALLRSFAARAAAELEHNQAAAERERLLSAIEQSGEIVVITDFKGTIQFVNPAFETVTKYSSKEALGQNTRILIKSGRHDQAFYRNLWRTILSGNRWAGRLTNRRKDGVLYTTECSISPVKNVGGDIVNFVWIARDITKQIELENRLVHSQKMEAIGTLAGGIAHDFNNILGAILGYADLARLDSPENSKVQNYVTQLSIAGERAKGLVQQILAFSRQGKAEKIPVDIGLIVKEAIKLLRASIPSTIEIRQNVKLHLGTVEADTTQIHQIVMNLCTNAFHAMEMEGGQLDVELIPEKISAGDSSVHPNMPPGQYLKLTVSDTGHGMDADTITRVFKPYFTTKGLGDGTGMGLAIVHGIAKDHGGDILVYSEPGIGTSFHVLLPITDGNAKKTSKALYSLRGGNERILFIDDEKPLVDIGKSSLEHLGYQVETRTSSHDALEAFRAQPVKYDLIVTDMTMPKMTGLKLAEEIRSIDPDIPIILCTGFSKRITSEISIKLDISSILMKPLTIHILAKTVRKVLDEVQLSNKVSPESEQRERISFAK